MKPFNQLRTYAKAKLLFDLFPEESKKSVEFIKSKAETFQHEPIIIGEFQTEAFWKEVAQSILTSIEYSGRRLYKSQAFADQLFDGIFAMFTIHCLKEYIMLPDIKYTRFSTAVELFF